ncbi:MAG: Cof-type HAD-IIB family hydrolase [Clostridiaceae bacterium]
MRYKLVCVDMDGTLLNSRKRISSETRKSVMEAARQGVIVAISTGRIYNNAAFYSKNINLKSPVIAANGAIITGKDSREIFKGVIGHETSVRILNILEKYSLTPHFHTRDSVFCGSSINSFASRLFMTRGMPDEYKIRIHSISGESKWESILKEKEADILKCITFSKSQSKIKKVKEELQGIKEIQVTSSNAFNIEINASGISKGTGARILSEHLGIEREAVMCIGDSENDLSMIEFAGLGVAMGNAAERVKEKADFVTVSNNNNGVGYAINKFILECI